MCSAKSLTSRRAGLPNYCRGIGSNQICERPPDRLICNRRGTRRGLTLRDYFEKLLRPDKYNRSDTPDGPSRSCCGAGDVVKTKFKVEVGNGKHPEDV